MEKIQVSLGAIKGRHPLPVKEYVIDEELSDVTDIVAIEEKVDSYFEKLDKEYKEAIQIILYITGLTVVTLAVVKTCKKLGYGLVCMHFNRDSNSYIAQPILD
mgnify:FL=1